MNSDKQNIVVEVQKAEVEKIENHKTNEFYINSSRGTVHVVEHYIGTQSYDDVIRAAIRRKYGG